MRLNNMTETRDEYLDLELAGLPPSSCATSSPCPKGPRC
jgi:hypothetical protein